MDRISDPLRVNVTVPSILSSSPFWAALGAFCLLGGLVLFLAQDQVFDVVRPLVESARAGPSPLAPDTAAAIREGIEVWATTGVAIGAIALLLALSGLRAVLARGLVLMDRRFFRPAPLPVDRYGWTFFLMVAGILAATMLAYLLLTAYEHVDWLEGEDGLSEWWTVAAYFGGAAAAVATAWAVRSAGYRGLSYFHLFLAVAFFLFAMEEISWGQRIFGWDTPAALEEVNQQGETTLHNLPEFAIIIFFALFWGSVAALAGGSLRAAWRARRPTTTMTLVLPSLMLAPTLVMLMIWRAGADWVPVNIARLIMDRYDYGPQGSEVPEVLLGLCIVIYTFANLRKALALRGN